MPEGKIKEIIKKENVKSTKTKKQINLGLKKKVKIEKSKHKKPWLILSFVKPFGFEKKVYGSAQYIGVT